jgi:NAD(P)-dependent dehydrogenase (short-subunit alcohol dehydrogenase family)
MNAFLEEMFSLADRRAVVIGGTGVLGSRMCRALAMAGAEVVVAGRDEGRGRACAESIASEGGAARFLPVDAARRDSIERLAAEAERDVGPIDVLVNAAGVNSAEPYFEIADGDWERVLATNLTSVHWSCQIFAAGMVQRRRGAIVNVGSASSDKPLSRVFAYSASKAAVVNYTQNLARELGPAGVRVNCLSPGFFPAEQNRAILDPQRTQAVLAHTPMGRFGEPADLDGALLLLASDRAGRFVTGANLFVDGGFTAQSI